MGKKTPQKAQKIRLPGLTEALGMTKNTQTKKIPSAPRERAPKPEPRPAEEPGGTVGSPRGKGVAVTQQFILTLPLRCSEQRDVTRAPLRSNAVGSGHPSARCGHFWLKKKGGGGVAEGQCAPWDRSFVYRCIAVQPGSPRR